MSAILQRDKAASDLVTLGKLYLPWIRFHPDIYTIELLWKNNKKKISCIPAGIYNCVPHTTINKKGISRKTWQLKDVPGRSGINFDIANYACDVRIGELVHKSQLEGCIAVGFNIDESIPMIGRSTDAMEYLKTTIGINTTWPLEIRD